MRVKFILLILLNSFFIPFSFCTDTSFWKQYKVDDKTYCLFHFDKDDFSDYEGKIKSVERIGEVFFEKEGKFGPCLKLNGKGAIKYEPEEIFSGGFISIECWIKLEKYPKKNSFIIYRKGIMGQNKGFSLFIDTQGRIHFTTTESVRGTTTVTSTPENVISLNKWTHIAAISTVWPIARRALYIDGKEIVVLPVRFRQGLEGEERIPSEIYIGNDETKENGFIGLIDELRIHTNIFKFWEEQNLKCENTIREEDFYKEPYFLSAHKPIFYLPFDNKLLPKINVKELEIATNNEKLEHGIKGNCFNGNLIIKSKNLIFDKEGSIEFWFQPVDINNLSDRHISFLETEKFGFKIANMGYLGGCPIPLEIRIYEKQSIDDSLCTEIYPGNWCHIVITWNNKIINFFINGRKAGEFYNFYNHNFWLKISFIKFNSVGKFDEIYLYDKKLTNEEIKNCFTRYLGIENLEPTKVSPCEIYAQYFPSYNLIYYQLIPNIPLEEIEEITLKLLDSKKNILSEKKTTLTKEEKKWEIPELKEDKYTIEIEIKDKKGEKIKGEEKTFIRKKFIWENNNLGITEKVYKPFEPVRVENNRVKIVLREYHMNKFGLFDKVITKGRDILSEPIKIKGETEKGDIKWDIYNSKGKFIEEKDTHCIYEGNVLGDALKIKTKTKIEFDGCAKIEMEIEPTGIKEKINSLYLEIPLKEKEIELFHQFVDTTRINYSGKLPEGEGIIWDSSKAKRGKMWLNNFVPYIWLGKEERGIAWFGENDKGYITEKNYQKPNETKPIQEIERKDGKIILRVYLINKPVVLESPTKLVFGLQASPTKPMPDNWRKKLPFIPCGISVVPWGGLECSYQGPYRDDWEIVDKIIECREKRKLEEETKKWFEEYNKKYNPPFVFGTKPWIESVNQFAEFCSRIGSEKPIVVYQEEMAASSVRDEWKTYQDEWTSEAYLYTRIWPDENIFRKIGDISSSQYVNFTKSYQEYGVWYANEWLKRGIGLYWDCDWLHPAYNLKMTDAYITENGEIQPCVTIWNQREYHKRVWNQLCYWREKRKEPLEWVLHRTNNQILPLHTFGTANLDHELGNTKPFTPDWLRTETIGLQVGNYPLSLYPVSGNQNEIINKLPKEKQLKIEWAMRMVHEIQRGPLWEKTISDLDKIIFDFGYGEEKIEVRNYWEEEPILEINNERVKWLGLIDKEKKELMLVLSSWSEKDEEIEIEFNEENIGFKTKGEIIDIETGEKLTKNIKLSSPYGVKIIKIN
ncbi:MAG: LamG domain-containing protein [Candidatus Omnitrophica bacterium]|nr:LamG domain-containing protein [Candidatus Omnitrophota bacterium]